MKRLLVVLGITLLCSVAAHAELLSQEDTNEKYINKNVPAGHWTYKALQSLYSQLELKGMCVLNTPNFERNTPLTRYEAAVAVARIVDFNARETGNVPPFKIAQQGWIIDSLELLDLMAPLQTEYAVEIENLGKRL